ncbi:MarR family winged helix-turn-helix transcriptional regulator [Microlunatus parietis]|uniref:DNA-binding MarR family transcriptional regulator n=1 Tax=Microlunatus parietis TaxID=682979 RepID=A0A7Y9I4R7_9ACTN|nr:MarR family transcriptional regulator [Microlunatus parietis]NYE70073.1 DNA-binding MarR family transcriptional regulator [Microlunatus parietis]
MADLRTIFHDLVRLEIELWDTVDAALRSAHDLPVTWFEILNLLDQTGGCRVQDMAEEIGITVGGVSKVVDRIENAGLCARRPNPEDRRSSLVELTAAGRRVLDGATKIVDAQLQERIGSVLHETELNQLATVLARLRTVDSSQEPN